MAAARKQDDDDSDGAIHKMDTLPPPEGEDDAYSAATKVGPMARAVVEAMMAKAQVDENSSLPPPASFTRGVTFPKPARLPVLDATPGQLEIDKIYDEVDDGDLFEPTALLLTDQVERAPRAPSSSAAAVAAEPQEPAPAPAASPGMPHARSLDAVMVAAVIVAIGLFAAIAWLYATG